MRKRARGGGGEAAKTETTFKAQGIDDGNIGKRDEGGTSEGKDATSVAVTGSGSHGDGSAGDKRLVDDARQEGGRVGEGHAGDATRSDVHVSDSNVERAGMSLAQGARGSQVAIAKLMSRPRRPRSVPNGDVN